MIELPQVKDIARFNGNATAKHMTRTAAIQTNERKTILFGIDHLLYPRNQLIHFILIQRAFKD
jgi:hypothetical protein